MGRKTICAQPGAEYPGPGLSQSLRGPGEWLFRSEGGLDTPVLYLGGQSTPSVFRRSDSSSYPKALVPAC